MCLHTKYIRMSSVLDSHSYERIPPESWVMRRATCSYCGYLPESFDDPCMREEMLYGQSWGWMYCTPCKNVHHDNVKRYCLENGYHKAEDVFQCVPSLKKMSDENGIRVVAQDSQGRRLTVSKGWRVYASRSRICTRVHENQKMFLHLENQDRHIAVWVDMPKVLRLNGILLFETQGIRHAHVSKCIQRVLHTQCVIENVLKYLFVHFHPAMPIETHSR